MQIGGSVLSSGCPDRCANFVISLTSRLLLSRGLLVIANPSCLLPINPGHTCYHRTIDAWIGWVFQGLPRGDANKPMGAAMAPRWRTEVGWPCPTR